MEERKGYNVLKMVMHGNRCYISTDYVRGKPLIQWLKYHPEISKEQLLGWVRDILRDLDCFHQSQGFPAYQYVNPYSMIISEEMKIYLLDPGGKGHEELLHIMQRKMVREHFLSPDNQFYQKSDVAEDIYGFGKSLQYLIASVEVIPSWSRKEEKKLRKIISKCLNQKSKKSYKTVREISGKFPKRTIVNNKKTKKINKRIINVGTVLLIAVISAALTARYLNYSNEIIVEESYPQEDKNVNIGGNPDLLYDLAFIYFLDQENYDKSCDVFSEIQDDEKAQSYAKLAEYLSGELIENTKLSALLVKLEDLISAEKDVRYFLPVFIGYCQLEEKENSQIIRLGEKCLEIDGSQNIFSWDKCRQEIAEILLHAYEEEAVFYEKTGEIEEAIAICKQGIERLGDEKDLVILLIRMQCANDSIERDVCASTIKKFIKEIPEIVEDEKFLELQQEYGIQFEGEEVFVQGE